MSSLFLAFSLKDRKTSTSLIYAALIAISQVIVSFEILSLFKAIYPASFLLCNVVFFAAALILYKRHPGLDPGSIQETTVSLLLKIGKMLKQVQHDVSVSLKADKILLFLSILFFFSVLISLFFVIFVPTNNADSLLYRLPRVAFWIQNASFEHYETTSLRSLVFPIYSELMILWSMIFVKRDYLALFPAFFSYLGSLTLIGVFLNSLNFSAKRILWVLLIVGSLPILILESSSMQNDLFMGFLLFTSFYLFFIAVKEDKHLPIIFSALAYAIALGAKSTAFLFIPAFAIVYILLSIKHKEYKYLLSFIVYGITAFILFSSYNYILNYINYGHFFGPASIVNEHVNSNLKLLPSSIILYLTYFADFSGIEAVNHINPHLINLYSNLNITDAVNIGKFIGFNYWIQENFSCFGLLGYLLILPFAIFSLTKIRSQNIKSFYSGISGIFLILFMLVLLLVMGFSIWNFRYLATAIILAAPVLVFSYSKKLSAYKVIITLIVAFNYTFMPLFMDGKPFFKVFSQCRNDLRLKNETDFSIYWREYYPLKFAKELIPDYSTIGLIFSETDIIYPFIETNPTWKIKLVRYENLIQNKKFDQYDYLITAGNMQSLYPLKNVEKYGYYINPTQRNLTFENNMIKTFYADHDGKILFNIAEKPEKMVNLVEEEKILEYFDKIKGISVQTQHEPQNRIYWIYKKKSE